VPILNHYSVKVQVVPMLEMSLERIVYIPLAFLDWKTKFRVQIEYKDFTQAILKTAHYFYGKSFVSEYQGLGKRNYTITIQLFWGDKVKR
jgi:hypothetical protein